MKEPSSLAIEVEDLRRRYRRARPMREALLRPWRGESVDALRGIGFTLPAGEVLGILGPNGAGKTSLVKILATLVLPSSGTARVFGHDIVTAAPAVLSRIGLVLADERSFYWRLTVRQNLLFFATLNDLEPRAREPRIDELVETVEIGEWKDRPFGALSAGIRQRVALARAMLTDPPLLLMDEPTNSLDPHAARQLRGWIRDELVARRGRTILLVTHDPLEAEELCSRIGILKEGRMVFFGTPSELGASRARGPGHRLRVSGWEDALVGTLASEGLVVRVAGEEAGGSREITVEPGGLELSDAFGLLSRHGVRVHGCAPVASTFSEMIAEMLGPDGEAR